MTHLCPPACEQAQYCRAQATEARLTPRTELLWFPYTPRKGRVIGMLLGFIVARDLRRRFRGGT